jgi:aerobic-type carbon monoxide dehydrogenase small subunit (CoxS/CutS family)
MIDHRRVSMVVNGQPVERDVETRRLLVDFLREDLGLLGVHIGCEHGICGTCTVLMNGETIRSCITFAVQADGQEIMTVEALSQGGKLHPLQEAFWEQQGLQCGYCTPAMMLRALEILRETPNPTREAVREGLASQLCRCTGYQFIIDAVMEAAQRLQRGTTGAPSGTEAEGMREQPAEAAAGPSRGGHRARGETPAEHPTPLGQPPGQPRGATEHGPDLDAVATHVATAMPQEKESLLPPDGGDEIQRMEREGRDLGTITAHPPIEEERTS